MPLFATLLVYLDADWRREWDAETLFLDAPTDTGVFVRPRGGRVVMMDQDVTHRISTPSRVGDGILAVSAARSFLCLLVPVRSPPEAISYDIFYLKFFIWIVFLAGVCLPEK